MLFIADCGCDSGWESFEMSCYKIASALKNWTSAENDCMEKGAHLTSIHSEAESLFLASYVRDAPFSFTGGRRTKDNSFSWNDGTTFNYENWEEQQPFDGSDCIGLMHAENHPFNGKWGTFDCDFPHDKYICKKPLNGNFQKFIHKEKCSKLT